jgi:hypothetical protein
VLHCTLLCCAGLDWAGGGGGEDRLEGARAGQGEDPGRAGASASASKCKRKASQWTVPARRWSVVVIRGGSFPSFDAPSRRRLEEAGSRDLDASRSLEAMAEHLGEVGRR